MPDRVAVPRELADGVTDVMRLTVPFMLPLPLPEKTDELLSVEVDDVLWEDELDILLHSVGKEELDFVAAVDEVGVRENELVAQTDTELLEIKEEL